LEVGYFLQSVWNCYEVCYGCPVKSLNVLCQSLSCDLMRFSLVKMVFGFASRSNSIPTWNELQHAILRNFGGLDDIKPVEVFAKHLRQIDRDAEVRSVDVQLCNAVYIYNKHLKNVGPIRHCEPPHAACSNFTLPFTRCRYCRHHHQDKPKPAIGIAQAACDSSDTW